MKINIWSDIRCPFCYIGKRKFERALDAFAHKDKVEVIWRSFQLDPGLKTQPETNVFDYLAEVKGMSRERSVQMHDHVVEVAREVGLSFNFDSAVVANSFNGHRLIQLAKARGIGGEAEEELFKAHFTEGKNIDDPATLLQVGLNIGLSEPDVRNLIASNEYKEDVLQDETMARSIGIRAVPHFIFDNKFSVSGAQPTEVFKQALEKAWQAYEKEIDSRHDTTASDGRKRL